MLNITCCWAGTCLITLKSRILFLLQDILNRNSKENLGRFSIKRLFNSFWRSCTRSFISINMDLIATTFKSW